MLGGMTPSLPSPDEMARAVERRDGAFEGVFFFAVRSTGVFCRPGCPARTPRREHLEFFPSPDDARAAGYRPCRRCRPSEPAGAAPDWLAPLLAELEDDPSLRLRDADLRARGLDPTRVRRWFRANRGTTFHGWQRARRLGAALRSIGAGADLLAAGYDAGFESPSGFREAFARLFGDPPGRARGARTVRVTRFATPLGPMLAAAADEGLCLLEWVDRRGLDAEIAELRRRLDAHYVPAEDPLLRRTESQLAEYFAGRRREFDLPLLTPGTDFERAAWAALREIPYGATRSYAEQAAAIGRPDAVRAVGRANGRNRVAIVIPCHRVVGANGALVGYGGQLWRKRALLDLERGQRAFATPGWTSRAGEGTIPSPRHPENGGQR